MLKFLCACIVSLISLNVLSMDQNNELALRKQRLDEMQNKEIGKISAVMGFYEANFSPLAKAKLNNIVQAMYEDLGVKCGYGLMNRNEFRIELIRKMMNKYLHMQNVNQYDTASLQIGLTNFLAHLEEALSDENFTSANSREQIALVEAVKEIYADNNRLYHSFLAARNQRDPFEERKLSHEHSQGNCARCDRDVGTEWYGDTLLCMQCRPAF